MPVLLINDVRMMISLNRIVDLVAFGEFRSLFVLKRYYRDIV